MMNQEEPMMNIRYRVYVAGDLLLVTDTEEAAKATVRDVRGDHPDSDVWYEAVIEEVAK